MARERGRNAARRSEIMHAAQIVEILGGPEHLSRPTISLGELRAEVREGLPFAAFEAVAEGLHLGRDGLAKLLSIPART
jgi:hypothetical protein